MTTITQAERLMKLETNVDNLDKKVDAGFSDVKTDLKALNSTVQSLIPTLVTQTQLTEKVTDLNSEIVQLKTDLESSKRKSSIYTFITSSLSAILAVILTILIQAYFNK